MSQLQSTALYQRLTPDTPLGANPATGLVPISEHVVFLSLVNHALHVAREASAESPDIYVDAHTASNARALSGYPDSTGSLHIVGKAVAGLEVNAQTVVLEASDCVEGKDHFIVFNSPTVKLLICGTADMCTHDHAAAFHGAWTVHAETVNQFLQQLSSECRPQAEQEPLVADGGMLVTLALDLMAHQAGDLVARQRDMALEKADLFAVLNILKAISARRRAHDVLYVFVEQIAQVVAADRCSIVRVWGGANTAKVLASHEDAAIEDHTIDLSKYPELRAAMDTRQKVVIQDVESDAVTSACVSDLKRANIRALLVIPIVLFDDNVGTLLLRAARSNQRFTAREMSFFEIVAEAAANALERAHLFESIQLANERLEQLAITDGLTGLYNRRYLHDQFEQEFQRAVRYGLPLACILMDIDDFKHINDHYGHLQGDNILQEISRRIRANVRSVDIAARYGGEELILIMPQTNAQGAEIEAERLRAIIANEPYSGISTESVTVSVGVGVLDPETMKTPDDLLRVTDDRLYRAKRSGKNQVVSSDLEGES